MEPVYQLPSQLKYLCLTFQGVAVLVAILALWLFFYQGAIDTSINQYWERISPQAQANVTIHDFKRLLLSAIATVAYFAPILILTGAFLTLGAFRTHDPLSLKSAKSVRFLGITIILYALSKIATFSLVVIALTYDNPPGTKEFAIAVDTHTLVTLMIGVIIVVIGHMLTEATRVAEENKQFI